MAQVQIAACDTFRSGAVEQLRTHCNRLNIPLYERGYEKDPAKVAQEAIKSAQRSNIDVLLVDTAGECSYVLLLYLLVLLSVLLYTEIKLCCADLLVVHLQGVCKTMSPSCGHSATSST